MKLFIVFVAVLHVCLSATIRQTCPLFCTEEYAPVCGTDGKTYSNQCHLHIATCHDSSIMFDHNGDCGTKHTLPPCPAMMCMMLYAPVCGSDGKTYSNECVFHTTHCHGDVTIAQKGACAGDLVVS